MKILPYTPDEEQIWDDFVATSHNGTFLHSRRFLSYHGDRFKDRSLLIYDAKDILIAVFPAALDPGDATSVVSHPGSSFGSLVHRGDMSGEGFDRCLTSLRQYLLETGAKHLIYKAVPYIYHRVPASEDLYWLFRQQAKAFRRDLAACVDLQSQQPLHQLRKRRVRKAEKAGLSIRMQSLDFVSFWPVLIQNLKRHGVNPVHTLEEIQDLARRCPDNLELVTIHLADKIFGGTLLFKSPTVTHCQYIASTVEGRNQGALDLLFHTLIQREREAGQRYFNFGISTEEGGQKLNAGLHRFKNGFGGGTIVHDFFHLEL